MSCKAARLMRVQPASVVSCFCNDSMKEKVSVMIE
jgi:hypothetical protein